MVNSYVMVLFSFQNCSNFYGISLVSNLQERISLSVLPEFDTLLSLEKFEKSKDLQIPELHISVPEEGGRAKRANQLIERIIDKGIFPVNKYFRKGGIFSDLDLRDKIVG